MKQKGLRKLVSMILAVVMCLGLTCTAFAKTETYDDNANGTYEGVITIKNAVAGEIYKAYQMLSLSYDGSNAYTYTVVSEWETFFKTGAGSTYFDYSDTTGYVTLDSAYVDTNGDCTLDSTQLAPLAQAALTYATANGISAIVEGTADSSGMTFNNLPLGYYLVDTSLGTLCSIDTTNKTAKIEEKNVEPTVEKTETTDGTAGIGDTVEYSVTIENAANISDLVYHDVMSDGLTFNESSVEVYVGGNKITTGYSVETTHTEDINDGNGNVTSKVVDGCKDNCTFEVVFSSAVTGNVTITYSATVNADAIIDGTDKEGKNNSNKGKLSYGNDGTTTWDIVFTDVYDLDIYKYTLDSSNQEVSLSDAKFVLYKTVSGTDYYATANKDTNTGFYKLTGWVEKQDDATVLISGSNGAINVDGLDAGGYYLLETEAPSGYNKLTTAITVNISDAGIVSYSYDSFSESGTIKVENNAGTELPSTGGIGTTIFYIVGGILVLGAAVLFVTKKRLGGEN